MLRKYLYGVTEAHNGKTLAHIGGGEGQAQTVNYRGLAAVVGDSPSADPSTLPKEQLVRWLFQHQSVLEKAMREGCVIPVKFGTTVGSTDEVARFLETGYDMLKGALHIMDGKVELDVGATWNKGLVMQDISRNVEIVAFKRGLSPRPTADDKIMMGKMVEACLYKKKEAMASEIVPALAEVAQDFCLHDTPDVTVIINTAFLVQKARQEGFEQRLRETDQKYGGRLNFRMVGPLPPYSFSTVTVKRADFQEIGAARAMLGLGEETSSADIKEAYWRLSAEHHPDKHPGSG
ncbi:MAG: GvpL/GvpF family gas vesicle protein [Chloroflexi bacterium]|nr:GvpL/GvpF family gas vesicle protein [Chloroflexota bacterium]